MNSKLRILLLYIMAVAQTINIAIRDVNNVQGLVITIALIMIMTLTAFGSGKKNKDSDRD